MQVSVRVQKSKMNVHAVKLDAFLDNKKNVVFTAIESVAHIVLDFSR